MERLHFHANEHTGAIKIMAQNIVVEECQGYYKAYVRGLENYYSLGKTASEAKAFLKKAIAERPDIYGS